MYAKYLIIFYIDMYASVENVKKKCFYKVLEGIVFLSAQSTLLTLNYPNFFSCVILKQILYLLALLNLL